MTLQSLDASERSRICERIYRAVQAIGPASASAIMHRAGYSMATTVEALRSMETRGAVRSVYDRSSNTPEMWSAVPLKAPGK